MYISVVGAYGGGLWGRSPGKPRGCPPGKPRGHPPPWKTEGTSPPGWKSEGIPLKKHGKMSSQFSFFLSTHKWPEFENIQNPGGGFFPGGGAKNFPRKSPHLEILISRHCISDEKSWAFWCYLCSWQLLVLLVQLATGNKIFCSTGIPRKHETYRFLYFI